MKIKGSLTVLAGMAGTAFSALAHPVSQGALDIQLLPQTIRINARVSGEEIFVANTFAGSGQPQADSLAEAWQRHGEYLLRHLRLSGDQGSFPGRVMNLQAGQNDSVIYQLEFSVPVSPARIRIEQDVLNEIEFAPGNPWEAAYMVRVSRMGQPAQEGLLLSRQQPLTIECAEQAATRRALDKTHLTEQFVRHGLGHILRGYDHLLFVIALVLSAATFWDLVKVITAFTLAHTITLTLSALNLIRLPSSVVEPMIAGSIVFVALMNVLSPERNRGRLRFATAFGFGLFHGLGFAGGLLGATEGMGHLVVFIAIAAFSLGVELGHQMVVLPFYFGLKLAGTLQAGEAQRERFRLAAVRGGSLLISLLGAFYLAAALR